MTVEPASVCATGPLGIPAGPDRDPAPGMPDRGSPRPPCGHRRRSRTGGAELSRPRRPRMAVNGPSSWPPLLSVDEERAMAERIKSGDTAARTELILANLR